MYEELAGHPGIVTPTLTGTPSGKATYDVIPRVALQPTGEEGDPDVLTRPEGLIQDISGAEEKEPLAARCCLLEAAPLSRGAAVGDGLPGRGRAPPMSAPGHLMAGLRLTGAVLRSRLPVSPPPRPLPHLPQRMAFGALAFEDEEAPRGKPLRMTPDRLSMAQTQSCSSSSPGHRKGMWTRGRIK